MNTAKQSVYLILSALLLLPAVAFAQPLGEPGIFQSKFEESGVAESFAAGKQWLPYPAYEDRDGWAALLGDSAVELIRRGEDYLDYQWKTVPATAYLAYERTGDRTAMESVNGANSGALLSLILAELAEGKGRFIDQIANGVWLNAQRYSWVLSAHQPRQHSGRSLPDDRDHLIDLG
ncbi:MAG: heparinase, partial [Prevotellaceae bacterium]|nr:heparinase [Prevotellaceae bacterium]